MSVVVIPCWAECRVRISTRMILKKGIYCSVTSMQHMPRLLSNAGAGCEG